MDPGHGTIAYLHDGTMDGFLTALDTALAAPAPPGDIDAARHRQSSLFMPEQVVATDADRAAGLLARIRREISPRAARRVIYAHLSELRDLGRSLYDYVQLGWQHGAAVDQYVAHPAVRRVQEVAAAVGGEIHRFKGLLRFQQIEPGLLWGPMAPDFNIAFSVALHFRKRLGAERWIVQDMRRGVAVYWDRHHLHPLDPEDSRRAENGPAPADDWARLWQVYFRRIAVPERLNPRLQRQFMPQRYWSYLVETPGRGAR